MTFPQLVGGKIEIQIFAPPFWGALFYSPYNNLGLSHHGATFYILLWKTHPLIIERFKPFAISSPNSPYIEINSIILPINDIKLQLS